MKILLIWPNSPAELMEGGDLEAISEPIALEYLAAGAQLDGHQVKILDLRLHPTDLDMTLNEFAPDVIGVTAYSMHILSALKICLRAKQLLPGCHTVVGGHHATLLPEDFFEPQIDFIVCGEGVRPFRVLLTSLENNRENPAIAGVWTRRDGTFVNGGPPSVFLIDELPLPDRSLVAADRQAYFIDWMRPVALVRTSVGCPYRCTFCSLWKIMEGQYIMRNIDAVVQEIAGVQEEFVFLIDDEAFINGPRMLKLAQALKAAGVYKRYFAYCRVDTMVRQPGVLAAWRDIGLERLFMGVDAISEKNLLEYNKKIKIAQIETAFKLAADMGIKIFAQFVVNTDFTQREFKQLRHFIEHNRIEYPSFTVLTPIPGTQLLNNFDNVTELQPNGRPNWDLFDCQNVVVKTSLPKEEFKREYVNLYHSFAGVYQQFRRGVNRMAVN
ncbi:MAG: Radical superfamily enzyme YgiQ, family [Chloroflexi bacterium]|nr:Radical superfamily enzyme YgiQ, family [Chloroflexota bacterium]